MNDQITISAGDYDGLLARYTWIRSRDNYAELPRGWVGIVRTMLDGMDAVLARHPGAIIRNWSTKEKLGGLREQFRLDGGSDAASLLAALRGADDAAERESLATCEVCGAPGSLRERRGWLSTRCGDHIDGD